MNSEKNNYIFHYKEHYFTLQKDYMLALRKEDNEIQVTRQIRNSPAKQEFQIDHGERYLGRLTEEGVRNQLSNIKQIVFEVTDACNLRCTYCSYGELYDNYDRRDNQYMDINKAKALIDFVIEQLSLPAGKTRYNDLMVSFYGGEPLLNMDFIQSIVAYTQKKKNSRLGFKYNTTTNGVYLKKHLIFLMKYNFRILISLDGSEIHDGHRKFHNGESSFKKVFNNVTFIKENYSAFFRENISFNAVLHNLNNEQEVFLFIRQNFDKTPLFSSINDTGVPSEMLSKFETIAKPKEAVEYSDGNMERILDLDSGINQSLRRFIFHFSGNVFRNYNSLLNRTDNTRYIPTGTCYPFSKKIFLTVTGKILPCERIGHQFALGRIAKNNEVEIDCEEVARKYNEYYDKLRKQCTGCFQADNCIQCIYIIKNIEKSPVICQGYTKKPQFESYLQEKIGQLYQKPILYKRIMEEITIE